MATPESKPFHVRLVLSYLIEVDGLVAAQAHAVQISEAEIEEVLHAGGGMTNTIGTAGGVKFSDLVIEKAMFASQSDPWAWDWLNQAVNARLQRIGVPSEYKKDVLVHHLDGNLNIIDTWVHEGCWNKKVSVAKNDAMDKSSKVVETITLRPDNVYRENRA